MSSVYSIIQKNGKFVVAKDGEPILLPKTDGQSIVTQFDTIDDAERYMAILNTLLKSNRYKKEKSHA